MFDIPSDNEPCVASQRINATMYCHYETMNDCTSLSISSITRVCATRHLTIRLLHYLTTRQDKIDCFLDDIINHGVCRVAARLKIKGKYLFTLSDVIVRPC